MSDETKQDLPEQVADEYVSAKGGSASGGKPEAPDDGYKDKYVRLLA